MMLEINNLSKKYGDKIVLKKANILLPDTGIVFLLGPNGAGKTTLMRLLCGILTPDSGKVLIEGENILNHQELLQKIGYVPENCPLYTEMTAYEYIKFIAALHGVKGIIFKRNLKSLAHFLELSSVLPQRIETLSKGYRRRVGIAAALMFQPEILFLDEPTEGLDPNQKHRLHALLKEYGKTRLIVISTHIMEGIESLAQRIVLLHHGEVIFDGLPNTLAAQAADNKIETAFRDLTGEKNNE